MPDLDARAEGEAERAVRTVRIECESRVPRAPGPRRYQVERRFQEPEGERERRQEEPQAAQPRASGRAFWSRSHGVMFTATGLPPLPKGKVYQLWVVTKSTPLSAGLLTPDGSGHVMAVADMPPGVEPVAVAVTIEPEGGVPSPTGARYLVGLV